MDALDGFSEIAPHLANPLVLVGFVLLLFFGIHRTLIKSGILQPISASQSGTVVKILLRYGFLIALLLIVAGFGFAAWKAYLAAAPKVDVNAIVETLTHKHEQELATAREREETSRAQIDELTKAVTALATQSEQPQAPLGTKEALQQLAEGNTQAAEAIFQDTLKRKEAEGQSAIKEAAEAARHLGALAFLSDTMKAVAAYRKATELDPQNLEGWLGLGDAAISAGILTEAERAFRQFTSLSTNAGNRRGESAGHDRIGDLQVAQGDLAGALKSYGAALEIAERLPTQDPGNAGWQRNLSVSHNKIGSVQADQGDLAGALKSYGAALEIRERLATQDPGNAGWQRDLSVSHEKIGDLEEIRGNLTAAIAAYEKSAPIAQSLADRFPTHPQFQSDIVITRQRLDELRRAVELQRAAP
jgi:tetratricopeptide (TPR) repeat protein